MVFFKKGVYEITLSFRGSILRTFPEDAEDLHFLWKQAVSNFPKNTRDYLGICVLERHHSGSQ